MQTFETFSVGIYKNAETKKIIEKFIGKLIQEMEIFLSPNVQNTLRTR